jgi:Asp-tRNA(Asn)/Glu-tRNA(Gln) amidotransferase A subunit family amidase
MKPSLGKIPTAGVVYFSPTVDHVGFFCRQAADIPTSWRLSTRWTTGEVLSRVRLGVPVGKYLDQVPGGDHGVVRGDCATLEAEGFEVVRVPCLDNIEEIAARHGDLIAAEFALEQEAWFTDYAHLYRPGDPGHHPQRADHLRKRVLPKPASPAGAAPGAWRGHGRTRP